MTNGGWPGHVIKDMEKLARGARIMDPMKIQFDSTGGDQLITKQSVIDQWIAQVISDLQS